MEIKFFRRQLHILCDNKILKFYDNNYIQNESLFFRKIVLKNKSFLIENLLKNDISIEYKNIPKFARFYEFLKENFSVENEKKIQIEVFQKNKDEILEKNKKLIELDNKGNFFLFKDYFLFQNLNSEKKYVFTDYNINEIFFNLYNRLHFQESLKPNLILKSEKSVISKENFSEKKLFLQILKKNEDLILKDQKNFGNFHKFLNSYFHNLKTDKNFDIYFKPIKTNLEKHLYKKTIPEKLKRKEFKISFSEKEKLKLIICIYQKYKFLFKDIFIKNKIKNIFYEEDYEDVLEIIKKFDNLENINFKKINFEKKIILKTSLKEVFENPIFFKEEKNFLK